MTLLRIVPVVLSAVFASILVAQEPPAAEPKAAPVPDALAIARKLATERYAGWSYGANENTEAKQIDCTCFLAAVCKELAKESGKTLDATTVKGIKIAIPDEDKKNLQALVEAGDDKIQGVASALVAVGLGTKVKPKMAQARDLVQYWAKAEDGTWHGHACVIEKVENGQATLFGSHQTALVTRADDTKLDAKLGGIGTGLSIPLTSKSYKLFVVRWSALKVASPAPAESPPAKAPKK